jgi:hypothetical protein
MKKIFSILFLSIFFAASANASEIFGKISTNPNQNPPAGQNNQSSSGSLPAGGQIIAPAAPAQEGTKAVLGTKIYPDGTLLRGQDHKIYLIQGQTKKYIVDLSELWKYRGRIIFSASEEELSRYNGRAHADGELIRQRGDVKIYVIANGAKKHVLDLEELRAHYAGLEIFNLEPEEMALYEN